jgi:hypothetical protein
MHFPTSNNAAKYEALLHDLGDSLLHSTSANSEFSRTHCSSSTGPIKSGHVWMTK